MQRRWAFLTDKWYVIIVPDVSFPSVFMWIQCVYLRLCTVGHHLNELNHASDAVQNQWIKICSRAVPSCHTCCPWVCTRLSHLLIIKCLLQYVSRMTASVSTWPYLRISQSLNACCRLLNWGCSCSAIISTGELISQQPCQCWVGKAAIPGTTLCHLTCLAAGSGHNLLCTIHPEWIYCTDEAVGGLPGIVAGVVW